MFRVTFADGFILGDGVGGTLEFFVCVWTGWGNGPVLDDIESFLWRALGVQDSGL